MTATKTIAPRAHQTCARTKNNMKTIYIKGQDLDVTANLRNLPTPQVVKPDAPRLKSLRPQAGLGALPADAQLQPSRQSAPERAGQTSGMARKSRCTPACTGTGCMSAQMAFARGVAGRAV